MGLTATSVAPASRGILDPATGKPIGANDPFFGALNDQLADKGFIVTTTDDLLASGAHRFADVADDLRPRLLRSRNGYGISI